MTQTTMEGLRIDACFPGGNIVVESVGENLVQAKPDFRDSTQGWFHWAFRIANAQGRRLRFEGLPIGVRGPAVSHDGRLNWRWLGFDQCDANAFVHQFGPNETEAFFAFSIPYLQTDWEKFLAKWRDDRRARPGILCVSRHGRNVETLLVGVPDREPSRRILVTSRHHCCEAMATYVLEGFIDAVLTGAAAGAAWLGENAETLVVPFVDKDGVEDGDQGKNRRPHDHGRDYVATPIYPETKTIISLIPAWSCGKLDASMDLHCPHIRGKQNEHVYQVGNAKTAMWEQQKAFGRFLEAAAASLPYRQEGDIPFGTDWNVAGNYKDGVGLNGWASGMPGLRLATSVEIPYANADGVEVNPASARAFGAEMADAMGRYLRENP